jgi:hypothetical protein
MAFRIHYRPLCTVNLRHGFHLNKGFEEFDELPPAEQKRQLARYHAFGDLRILVPPDTHQALRGLGCLVKIVSTGFIVLAEVGRRMSEDGPFVPTRIPGAAFRLRFILVTRQPHFANYTNLGLGARDRAVDETAIYYLSNRAVQLGGEFPDLSAAAADFVPGVEYSAGDVVRTESSIDATFLAVRFGEHAAPPAGGDSNWLKLGSHTYVSGSDRIPLRSSLSSILLPLGADVRKVELVALDGKAYQAEIIARVEKMEQQKVQVHIDVRHVPAGRYNVRVTGIAEESVQPTGPFYLDRGFPTQSALAVVELFHETGNGLDDFSLYNETVDQGVFLRDPAPEFFVRLLNRHTFWRYRFPDNPLREGMLAHPGDHLEPFPEQATWYVTKEAMPLTRGFQEVRFGNGAESLLLPNPSVNHILPVPQDGCVYSDVYVPFQPE